MATRIDMGHAYASQISEGCGWPDGDTALRFTSSAVNAVFEATQASFTHTWAVGIPLRLCGVVIAARSGSCLGFLGHSLAFAALFHPWSRLASIGVDAASECLKICSACCSSPSEEFPTNTAYSVLGLSSDRSVSLDELNRARRTKINELTQKQKSKGAAEWQRLQKQIDAVYEAYRKLWPIAFSAEPNQQLLRSHACKLLGIRDRFNLETVNSSYHSMKKYLETERDRFPYMPQRWKEKQAQIDDLGDAHDLLTLWLIHSAINTQ